MVSSKEFAQKLYNFYIESGQKERAEELLKARPQHIEVTKVEVKKEVKKDGKK